MGDTAKDSTPAVHLSIGEVLSLLQDDFPDVTISKIRFLESQGLIAPERTASGYRKFYDSDIERLRWILTQQRDHFLPLKVIKRMLDQGIDIRGDGEQAQLFADPAAESDTTESAATPAPPASPTEHRSMAHPAVAAAHGVSAAGRRRPAAGDAANDPAMAGGASGESGSGSGAAAAGEAASGSTAGESIATDGQSPDSAAAPRDSEGDRAVTSPPGPGERDASERSTERKLTTPADVVAALQESPRTGRRRQEDAPVVTEHAGRSGSLGQPAEGEKLTADELCAAAGIDADLLADLEQYGLVVPSSMGGRPTYDGDALVVARLTARCSALGIEPRHLRIYKIAAEREAGLLEQSIMPLLKQRNPAAREQAVERADEVLAIGAELHATLLRRNLGPILGL